jgi:ribosomal protein S18 acetylase RimI-like enzyme
MFLEVGTDNPAALALYTSLGFQRVGARKGYYASHSQSAGDALVLKAALSPAGNLA